MTAGSTYTKIATTTLGTATTTVSFSSIPSTYTDLILICNPTGIDTPFRIFSINGDTGANYSYTYLQGNGSGTGTGRNSGNERIFIGYGGSTTTPMTTIAHFQNYSNTTTYKTILARGSSTNFWVTQSVGLWRSTAAINAFNIVSDSTNFAVGSTFTIYGVSAA